MTTRTEIRLHGRVLRGGSLGPLTLHWFIQWCRYAIEETPHTDTLGAITVVTA